MLGNLKQFGLHPHFWLHAIGIFARAALLKYTLEIPKSVPIHLKTGWISKYPAMFIACLSVKSIHLITAEGRCKWLYPGLAPMNYDNLESGDAIKEPDWLFSVPALLVHCCSITCTWKTTCTLLIASLVPKVEQRNCIQCNNSLDRPMSKIITLCV